MADRRHIRTSKLREEDYCDLLWRRLLGEIVYSILIAQISMQYNDKLSAHRLEQARWCYYSLDIPVQA